MSSYSCCSGGVMYVAEEIERQTNAQLQSELQSQPQYGAQPQSYWDLIAEEATPAPKRKLFGWFGRKEKAKKACCEAA
ncbi:MAG: hypothetical protein ACPGRX_07060 [Bdellovibrionales bacterium]